MSEQDDHQEKHVSGNMTLIEHLTELRNRLGIAIAIFILVFLVTVAPIPGTTNQSISYQIFVFLQAPLASIIEERGGGRMIFTALHEGFYANQSGIFFCFMRYLSSFLHSSLEICCSGIVQE